MIIFCKISTKNMFTSFEKNIIVIKRREEVKDLDNKSYIFGNKITKYRKMKKMTQDELAEKLDVSKQAVSKWENGKSFPRFELFTKVCEELEIDLTDVMKILLNM